MSLCTSLVLVFTPTLAKLGLGKVKNLQPQHVLIMRHEFWAWLRLLNGEYMFQHNNPHGISISQAKKDAKKLSRIEGLPLNKAQDRIAFEHGRCTWAQAMQQPKQSISLSFSDNNGEQQTVKFPQTGSVSLIVGISGSGKSVLSYDMIAQLAKQKIHSTYLSKGIISSVPAHSPEWFLFEKRLLDLKQHYPSLLHFHDAEKWLNAEKTALNGGVLFVDEYFYLSDHPGLHDLMRAARHTIIAIQSFDDLSSLPDGIIRNENLMMYLLPMMQNEQENVIRTVLEQKYALSLTEANSLFNNIRHDQKTKRGFLHIAPYKKPQVLQLSRTTATA